jgi:hypothetical protein
VCALLRAKCATHPGPYGSLLVLQDVSVAEDNCHCHCRARGPRPFTDAFVCFGVLNLGRITQNWAHQHVRILLSIWWSCSRGPRPCTNAFVCFGMYNLERIARPTLQRVLRILLSISWSCSRGPRPFTDAIFWFASEISDESHDTRLISA